MYRIMQKVVVFVLASMIAACAPDVGITEIETVTTDLDGPDWRTENISYNPLYVPFTVCKEWEGEVGTTTIRINESEYSVTQGCVTEEVVTGSFVYVDEVPGNGSEWVSTRVVAKATGQTYPADIRSFSVNVDIVNKVYFTNRMVDVPAPPPPPPSYAPTINLHAIAPIEVPVVGGVCTNFVTLTGVNGGARVVSYQVITTGVNTTYPLNTTLADGESVVIEVSVAPDMGTLARRSVAIYFNWRYPNGRTGRTVVEDFWCSL